MKYFSYIGNTLSTSNKLQKAFVDYICANNRLVVDETEVETFKQNILDGIAKLNAEHPRCKPIRADWWMPSFKEEDKDTHLHSGGFIQFALLASKH